MADDLNIEIVERLAHGARIDAIYARMA